MPDMEQVSAEWVERCREEMRMDRPGNCKKSKKISRKKTLAECMVEPIRDNPIKRTIKLEIDEVLLMKLRTIFRAKNDKYLSKDICDLLWEYARDEEVKDIERRVEIMRII